MDDGDDDDTDDDDTDDDTDDTDDDDDDDVSYTAAGAAPGVSVPCSLFQALWSRPGLLNCCGLLPRDPPRKKGKTLLSVNCLKL